MNLKTLPNILRTLRIGFAFLLLAILLYGRDWLPDSIHPTWINYLACLIFCLASITDFFDGFIARNFQVTSVFGEIFDPLADKLLMLSAFIGFLTLNVAVACEFFLILGKDFSITGLRVFAPSKGLKVAASTFGKYKTGLQFTAIAFLLMDYSFANATLWLAVIITLYSGYDYAKAYTKTR